MYWRSTRANTPVHRGHMAASSEHQQTRSDRVWKRRKNMFETATSVLRDLRHTEHIRVRNVAAAIEKMGMHAQVPPQNNQIPQCAIQFLSGLIRDDEAMLPAINANELSRLVWGIAMLHTTRYFNDLQHTTSAWPWERMDSSALELASQFSHEELAKLLWAYSKLEHTPRQEVLKALRDQAMDLMPGFTSWQLANVASAFTRMEFSPGEDFLVSCTAAALILGADAFTPKAVCMLMHSFAMCGWLPGPALMREVEQLAIRRCKDFSSRELANLLWALASLGHYPTDQERQGPRGALLLDVVADEVAHRGPGALLPQDVAQLLWGYGTLNHHPGGPCMAALLAAAESHLASFKPKELVNMLWGASILESRPLPKELFRKVGSEVAANVESFTPQGLSNTLLVYAKAYHKDEQLLQAVSEQMAKDFRNFNGQDMATIMHAFSRLKHELPKLTLSRVEGFTVSMIQSLSSEELTKICSALNRMEHRPGLPFLKVVSARLEIDTSFTPEESAALEDALRSMSELQEYGDEDALLPGRAESKASGAAMLLW